MKIKGVAMVLFRADKIFVLEELKGKLEFGKNIGDLSVPMETQESGEDDSITIARLFTEEVGQIIFCEPLYLGQYNVLGNAVVRAYSARFIGGEIAPKDFDIRPIGWMDPHDFLQKPLRCCAGEIVLDFLKQKHAY